MRILPLLFLLTSAFSLVSSKTHGDSCTVSDIIECQPLLICYNHICACPVKYMWQDNTCKPFITAQCQYDRQCNDIDTNRFCNRTISMCLCRNQTFEDIDGLCKSVYNRNCKTSNDCFGLNCTATGYCRCPVGQMFEPLAKRCFPFNMVKCNSDSSCQDADLNTMCWNQNCICKSGFVKNATTSWCQQLKTHNEVCESNDDCSDRMLCKKSAPFLTYGQCKCPVGYLWSYNTKTCLPFSQAKCQQDIDCQDWDSQRWCFKDSLNVQGSCQCQANYRTNSTGFCTSGANRHETCGVDSDCQQNMTCTTEIQFIKQCLCSAGYFWSNFYNKCLKIGDYYCYSDADCQDQEPRLRCTTNQCQCPKGYQLKSGLCQAALLTPCTTNVDCQVPNSVCNKDKRWSKCTCKQTDALIDGSCQPKRCGFGCWSDDYYDDSNMECSPIGTCWCKSTMNSLTGKCNTPFNYNNSYSIVWFWMFGVFMPMVMGPLIIFLVIRHIKRRRSEERCRLINAQATPVAIVQPGPTQDYAPRDRPPKYSE